VAIRPAGLFARRLARAPLPAARGRWAPRGTALVTGGTGAIGGHVARWLAARGTPHLVLASRSGPAAPGAAELAADLAGAGAGVTVACCDSAERSGLSALLDRISASGPALSAVLHAAGTGQATAIADTSLTELATVASAKTAGAALLDELTAGLDLDRFVLFSSIAATWGSGLQPAYAAGNAFLDALAEDRSAQGFNATSVAWGPWDGGGMTDPAGAAQLRRRGLRVMDPDLAVRALGQILDGGERLVTVADVDWDRFAPAFTVRRPSPLIAALPEAARALAAAAADPPAESGTEPRLRRQLVGLPPTEQRQVIVDLVRAEAATVLGHASAAAVAEDRAFKDLGFDSLTAVELRNRLSAATGLPLPATLIFDHPTPAAIGEYLWTEEFTGEEPQVPLLAELDKLESLLSHSTPDGATHELVAARLQGFLSQWSAIDVHATKQAVAQKIESASDDEIFDFINKELGRSPFTGA
jgi:short-subunit dehydrogenase/acyl carrier protein